MTSLHSLWTPTLAPSSSLLVKHASISVGEKRDIRLRPYQEQGIQRILDLYEQGYNKIVMELPTGSGKTYTAMMLLRRLLTESEHALFLVPSIDLTRQTTRVARSIFSEREVGRYQGEYHEVGRKITIATVATLKDPERRAELQASILGRQFSTIIFDEAHGGITDSGREVVEALLHPYGLLLGMTATPWRRDGKSLRRLFPSLSHPAFYVDVLDLIALGYLVGVKPYKMDTDLDLEKLEVVIEDEEIRQGNKPIPKKLMDRIRRSNKYEQGYRAWVDLFEKGSVIYYGDSVPDAYAFQNYVMERNGLCSIIHSGTPEEQREEILELLNQGSLPIVSNFGTLTTGIDLPNLQGVIIGRHSLMGENPNTALHQQIIGRILRPSNIPGHKPYAKAVYLTCKRYPNVPIVMSMGLLPGTIESLSRTSSSPRSPKEEVQEKEDGETQEEELFFLRLKQLKVQITDLFCGEGWTKHFDESFSKSTRLGNLVAEREGGLDTYSIFLERDNRRHRITEHPVPVREALARGIQYVKRKELETRMGRGDQQSEEARLPLNDGQKDHLRKRRGMKLPKLPDREIDFSQMNQGIYFQIVALLKKRDQMVTKPLPIVIWTPEQPPRLWTPQK